MLTESHHTTLATRVSSLAGHFMDAFLESASHAVQSLPPRLGDALPEAPPQAAEAVETLLAGIAAARTDYDRAALYILAAHDRAEGRFGNAGAVIDALDPVTDTMGAPRSGEPVALRPYAKGGAAREVRVMFRLDDSDNPSLHRVDGNSRAQRDTGDTLVNVSYSDADADAVRALAAQGRPAGGAVARVLDRAAATLRHEFSHQLEREGEDNPRVFGGEATARTHAYLAPDFGGSLLAELASGSADCKDVASVLYRTQVNELRATWQQVRGQRSMQACRERMVRGQRRAAAKNAIDSAGMEGALRYGRKVADAYSPFRELCLAAALPVPRPHDDFEGWCRAFVEDARGGFGGVEGLEDFCLVWTGLVFAPRFLQYDMDGDAFYGALHTRVLSKFDAREAARHMTDIRDALDACAVGAKAAPPSSLAGYVAENPGSTVQNDPDLAEFARKWACDAVLCNLGDAATASSFKRACLGFFDFAEP